jgi:hypothetical protein
VIDAYADYLLTRDSLLGWPAPSSLGEADLDRTGSRVTPAFPDPERHPACISLYGDSYTWSNEVDNEHAWGNVLSQLAGCRAANYGVGGYGTDQAYLRFAHNPPDSARIVILCHLSENIMRNVNRYRDLLYAGQSCGFKPRFVLNQKGDLELLPIPAIPEDQYADFARHPERYLEYDYFLPGGRSGMRHLRFPYTWSIVRAFWHFHIRARLAGRPWYAEFYRADHPARGLQLTARILETFVEEARAEHRAPLVVIIPTGLDLVFFQKHGAWIYESLLDRLRASGIEPLDLGAGIMAHLAGRDPCALFTYCSAHYNAEGYRVIATLVHEELIRRGLLP